MYNASLFRRTSGRSLLLVLLLMAGAAASHGGWSPNPLSPLQVDIPRPDLPHARAVSDGAGGVIVLWGRADEATSGVYAQRYSPAGEPLWGAEGKQVWKGGTPLQISATSDSNGDALLAVYASQGPYSMKTIHAQKVTPEGGVPWGLDGVHVISDSFYSSDSYDGYVSGSVSYDPRIVPDGAGGALIAFWFRSYDDVDSTERVKIVRIGAQGVSLWQSANEYGSHNTSSSFYLNSWDFAGDGAGGAVIVWPGRSGQYNYPFGLVASRVDPDGNRIWGEHGKMFVVDSSGRYRSGSMPSVTRGQDGDWYVAWVDTSNTQAPRVLCQRLNGSGEPQWSSDGVAVSGISGAQDVPVVYPGGSDVFVVFKGSEGGDRIWLQRLNGSGQRRLGNGVALGQCASDTRAPLWYGGSIRQFPQVIGDDSHLYVSWEDDRPQENNYTTVDLMVQRVSYTPDASEVSLVWGSRGRSYAAGPYREEPGCLIPDGKGGAYAAFSSDRNTQAESSQPLLTWIPGFTSFISDRQRVRTSGWGYETLIYHFSTGGVETTGFQGATNTKSFWMGANQWIGAFHYDYTAGRFTQGMYSVRDPL